jgi:hypothetical protein
MTTGYTRRRAWEARVLLLLLLVVLLTAGIALAGHLGASAPVLVLACVLHTLLLAVAWGVWNTKP